MKKVLKIIGWILLTIVLLAFITYGGYLIKSRIESLINMDDLGPEADVLREDGMEFRDLNNNDRIDVYEDRREPMEARVEDLLKRMTLEEKAGLMFITMTGMDSDGSLLEWARINDPLTFLMERNSEMVVDKKMNHFNIAQSYPAEVMARWNNNIQKLAERTRLGIPVTIATDPRHSGMKNFTVNVFTKYFSTWPSFLGLAATRDTALVKTFGNVVRQEYRAVGMTLALHPMADLATEPRWGRISGTFGSDAHLTANMVKAYIMGLQGDSLNEHSVAAMTKHFPGGGPQKDGDDPHFPYGKDQIYPGDNFDYHLIPFEEGAFPANTAQIMPYYAVPEGTEYEDVAFGFNKKIITGLLREKYNYDGVVCTDWGIITDRKFRKARAWGVENLSEIERVEKVINAGCDMFGGESYPDMVIELVRSGQISESRIDESVKRILRDKFELGLFDDPYVDPQSAARIVRNETFVKKGKKAQRQSMVLLKNKNDILPLEEGSKVYIDGIDEEVAEEYARVVSSRRKADFVVLKLQAPYEVRNDLLLERLFRQGSLEFIAAERRRIMNKISDKPSVVVITLDRPAVIPKISKEAEGLIADFENENDAILDIVFGRAEPQGKLPVELPSSMEAVKNQLPDVPYDTKDPLYPHGYGLEY
jgi:beta-glucosidase